MIKRVMTEHDTADRVYEKQFKGEREGAKVAKADAKKFKVLFLPRMNADAGG
jgi:hypothetical protein